MAINNKGLNFEEQIECSARLGAHVHVYSVGNQLHVIKKQELDAVLTYTCVAT